MPEYEQVICAVDNALAAYQRLVDRDDQKQNFIETFVCEQLQQIKDKVQASEYLSSFIDHNEELLAEYLESIANSLWKQNVRETTHG
ncbi:hypothetical protein [Sansalvadorimonas verongulae]|uniref:hypothetical protein n=1 Tax=Sansalvadorimonas verongulae TaxID=2172824 RepID=UPI0012BCC98B|nr:hypothetical protein [Sansalvadorimonas verongulae]MTI12180.1 hypothetical protein [Sansalvadorimonas verongulae]